MPENNASPPSAHKPPEKTIDYAHVPMGEEFSSSKWTLPPVGIVAIAIVVVAIVVGAVVWLTRAKPGAAGTIDDIAAVETSPGNVMVAVQVTLRNVTDKPFWVRQVDATIQSNDGKEYRDTAASGADFERYFQAFPELRQHATADPLKRDIRIPPGASIRGAAIFTFPLAKAAFEQRKSLSLIVGPFDQPVPVVLTK